MLYDINDGRRYLCLTRQPAELNFPEKLKIRVAEVILAGLGPPAAFIVPSTSINLIFMHRIGNNSESIEKLSNPLIFGLENVTYLKIDSKSGNKIGCWYSSNSSSIGSILLCHGTGGNRGYPFHRVKMFKILRSAGFNVLSIDYSGFGDSSGVPSYSNVVNDVISAFIHLKSISNGLCFIYAHSLGTSIAVEANLRLHKECIEIDGIVLDSPLHSMRQEIIDFPYGKLMQKLYTKNVFEKMVDFHLTKDNLHFDTHDEILKIKNPILILAAEDDKIVYWNHAQTHFTNLCKNGISPHARFILFESWHHYGHDGCILFIEIFSILAEFISTINDLKSGKLLKKYHADVM